MNRKLHFGLKPSKLNVSVMPFGRKKTCYNYCLDWQAVQWTSCLLYCMTYWLYLYHCLLTLEYSPVHPNSQRLQVRAWSWEEGSWLGLGALGGWWLPSQSSPLCHHRQAFESGWTWHQESAWIWSHPSLVTNSITFCWFLTIKDQIRK